MADTCFALDGEKQRIHADKQAVDETHRDDCATRDRLKAQLDTEQDVIDAQKQTLGC